MSVKVLVHIGDKRMGTFELSRVPSVGELIVTGHGYGYKVLAVMHGVGFHTGEAALECEERKDSRLLRMFDE